MNAIDDENTGWDALATRWQAQPSAAPDVQALEREVHRRSRRLRVAWSIEGVLAVLSIGNCVRALSLGEPLPVPAGLVWFLMALVIAMTGWTLWQRRRQWRAQALDARALMAFERERSRTALRIWRVSIWVSVALWTAMVLWALLTAQGRMPMVQVAPPAQWALSIVVNALVVAVFAVAAWVICRRHRQRLQRLHSMEKMMDVD
ncbi:hypothetical protein BIZ42_10005 [Stenotrophomonas sp. LM091]|uniref:hypothetical protein n=1 Tax=Stenotrophomonas sp. LM091 TaxID=1904944 RepID=UPI00089DEB79|nr:hypothetical protein [Stenotrophomonas sp. LM091]AOX62511.1 hypothetical protein BIZ42_10005 [Stenotrophomonas sp. LM091]